MCCFYCCSTRVCYRTTVTKCDGEYSVYLSNHTEETPCAGESNELLPVSNSSNAIFLQSPRYGCGNKDDFTYRNNEFCLYDISIANCTSGMVVVDNELHFAQELEQKLRNNICSDYLQFYYGSSSSARYCSSDLSRLKLEIPATDFTAIFWTDASITKLGFKLRVRCLEESEL